MDKQTKMYVGLGVAAVAGYLLYNNWKKNQPKVNFARLDAKIAGKRMGMVGLDATQKQNAQVKDSRFSWGNSTFPTVEKKSFSAQNEVVKDGSWANASGDNIAPNFFQVHDSENSFRNR